MSSPTVNDASLRQFSRAIAALDQRARHTPLDHAPGARLRYANPRTGGHPFPTTVAPCDVFVVPPWRRWRIDVARAAVPFSYSDRTGQEALGFWREWRQ